MRKQWMHIGKKQTHRYIAGFFAILMSYQAISPCLDTAANELHKVHLADTLGKYYGQDIQPKLPLNTETVNTDTKEKVKKEAQVYPSSSAYDEKQELVEQRKAADDKLRIAVTKGFRKKILSRYEKECRWIEKKQKDLELRLRQQGEAIINSIRDEHKEEKITG